MRAIYVFISVLIIYSVPCVNAARAQADITAGEYFFDSVGNYGDGMPISINSPDSTVHLDFDMDIQGLGTGFHKVFVRFRDSNGKWGQTRSFSIRVDRSRVPDLVEGEYFIDQAGEYGSGESFSMPAADSTISLIDSIEINALTEGPHRLFVRFRDETGKWSHTHNYALLVHHPKTYTLAGGEYFIDQAGAYGTGTPLPFDSAGSTAVLSRQLVVDSLENGFHRLFVRFMDNHGQWSQTYSYPLIVKHNYARLIVAGEYFFDPDTDYGEGYAIVPDSLGEVISLSRTMTEGIDTLGSPAQDTIYFRFVDHTGKWSHTYFSEIEVIDCPDELHLRNMQLQGTYRASQRIIVSGNSTAVDNLTLESPNVDLDPHFESPLGPIFIVRNDNCATD